MSLRRPPVVLPPPIDSGQSCPALRNMSIYRPEVAICLTLLSGQKSHKIAPNSLDFPGRQSTTVSTLLAKAAEACASAGSVAEGIAVSMDIEQLIYEAGRLHDAASLLNRLSQA